MLFPGEVEEKKKEEGGPNAELTDPLPEKMRHSVTSRLSSDLVFTILIMLITFGVHVSTGEILNFRNLFRCVLASL